MQERLAAEVELGGNNEEDGDKIFANNKNGDIEEEETKHGGTDDELGVTVIEDDLSQNEDDIELGKQIGDTWSKYKIMTWNLWCIPVSSPRCLSNPDRCSTYLRDLAEKQQWQDYDGLIVCAIQEFSFFNNT